MNKRKESRSATLDRLTWDELDPKFKKGSRYAIADSPHRPDLIDREVVVMEKPRRNEKTVSVVMEGQRIRWPIPWLRAIIDNPPKE